MRRTKYKVYCIWFHPPFNIKTALFSIFLYGFFHIMGKMDFTLFGSIFCFHFIVLVVLYDGPYQDQAN